MKNRGRIHSMMPRLWHGRVSKPSLDVAHAELKRTWIHGGAVGAGVVPGDSLDQIVEGSLVARLLALADRRHGAAMSGCSLETGEGSSVTARRMPGRS